MRNVGARTYRNINVNIALHTNVFDVNVSYVFRIARRGKGVLGSAASYAWGGPELADHHLSSPRPPRRKVSRTPIFGFDFRFDSGAVFRHPWGRFPAGELGPPPIFGAEIRLDFGAAFRP